MKKEPYGASPEDVRQDLEGLQTMRNLGRNMAYLIKCIDATPLFDCLQHLIQHTQIFLIQHTMFQ